ncbi:MAG: heparinase II/III family protein [Phycisphaerae bacterium]|nr:heparinase II/III family protein [Phycisphaerae bacterium]
MGAAPNEKGRRVPRASSDKHPSLLLDSAEIARIRKKIDTYPWAKRIFRNVRSRAKGTNLDAAKCAAVVYAVTGDSRHAKKAYEILVNCAREKCLPKSTLDVGVTLPSVAMTYDLIWNYLKPAQRKEIEDDLFRPLVGFLKSNSREHSNWQANHNAGLMALGLILNDSSLVDMVINHPTNGFKQHIGHGLHRDGIWWEGSPGYHLFTLRALVLTAEMARHRGIDLYNLEVNGNTMKKMFDSPFFFARPDMSLPIVNDSGQGNLLSRRYLYEIAYARYGDRKYAFLLGQGTRDSLEALLYGVDELEKTPSLSFPSTNFPDTGWSVLKNPRGLCLLLDYGPHGHWHGHYDKLSIDVHGLGRSIFPGLGCPYGYSPRIHWGWYRTTLAHNTVVVDGKSQVVIDTKADDAIEDSKNGGESLFFLGSTSSLQLASARADYAYPGVKYQRTVALADTYIIDLFRLEDETPHTYDYVLHGRGDVYTGFERKDSSFGFRKDGYQYLVGVREGRHEGLWKATFYEGKLIDGQFQRGKKGTRIYVGAERPTTVFTAYYPSMKGKGFYDPLIISRRRAKKTLFATVIHPFEEKPRLKTVSSLEGKGFQIESSDHTDFFLWESGKTGRFETDSRMSYLRQDRKGGLVSLCTIGGSIFKIDKHSVVRSRHGNTDVRLSYMDIKYADKKVEVNLPQRTDLSIYAPEVEQIVVNGKITPFDREGDYAILRGKGIVLDLDPRRTEAYAGESAELRLILYNYTSKNLAGSVKLELPPGWKGGGQNVKIGGKGSVIRPLRITIPAKEKEGMFCLKVCVEIPPFLQEKREIKVRVTRPLRLELASARVETKRGKEVSVHVPIEGNITNKCPRTLKGEVRLQVPSEWALSPRSISYTLPPKRSKQFSFNINRQGKAITGAEWSLPLKVTGTSLEGGADEIQKEIKMMIIRKTEKPPLLDGKLEEECWKHGAQVELPGKVKTCAYITCDQKNLYLAFDCPEPFMDKLLRTRTAHDSKVWRDDAVDLIFDTPAEQGRYFYFALNCIGAKYDQKTMVRPGEMNKNDVDWNPDWKAKTVLGKKGWTAEVAIPFASLGVKPPEKGEVWKINMRRWRHAVVPREITKWASEFWASEERGNLIFW